MNNWEIKKFSEIFILSAGGDIDKKNFSLKKTEEFCYPVFGNAIKNEGLYGYSNKYKIDKESLTITARGDIGKIFYREAKYTPIVRLIVCLPKDNISAKFMSYACSRIKFINETTGVPQLTIPNIKNYQLPIPPLEEQEKIVSILSKQDEVIEKLEKLIDLKVRQKKGLMQRLLSGKLRLKGFSGEWENVKAKELFLFRKGEQLNKANMLKSGLYPVLNGGVSFSGYTDKYNTLENTITISEGGNSCGFVNRINCKFWSGGHCYNLYNIKINENFLYYILKHDEFNIMKLRVGSGLPNIQRSSIENIVFYIPLDKNEQSAIASILSKCDEEIELLKKKLGLYRGQKKWLMEKLLSGEIRV